MDPSQYTGALLWLPPVAARLWTGAVGASSNPVNLDDPIQHADSGIANRVLSQAGAANRPLYQGDGWIYCGLATANRWFTLDGSAGVFDAFHASGSGGIMVAFQRLNADAAAQEMIFANHNASVGRQGFTLQVNTAENVVFTLDVGGATIGSLNVGNVADTATHVVEIRLQGGRIWGRLDQRAPVTASLTGALGAGSASSILRVGVREGNTLPANMRLRDGVIFAQPAVSADRRDWFARNPYASASASLDTTVLVLGKLEVVLRKLWAWTVQAIRHDGYTLLDGAAGLFQGTVISIGGAWHGSGHGYEAITGTSITGNGLPPAALAPGLVIDDALTVVRESELGTTFLLRSTMRFTRDGYTERIRLERRSPSDGKTISAAAYLCLGTRAKTENLYAWYDAAGAVLGAGDFDAAPLETDVPAPTRARAIVQFDATAGKGLVTILLDPGSLTPDLFIRSRAEDNKFYGRMQGLDGSPAGAVFVTDWAFVVIEASAATWQALAGEVVRQAFAAASPEAGHGIVALHWAGMISF